MQLLILLLLVTASLSLGASTIEEIIVTADLKEKQEIDIASSVFVLSEEALEACEASHLEDVVNSIQI